MLDLVHQLRGYEKDLERIDNLLSVIRETGSEEPPAIAALGKEEMMALGKRRDALCASLADACKRYEALPEDIRRAARVDVGRIRLNYGLF